MNNKTQNQENGNGIFTLPPVFTYVAENAVFVLCETSDNETCHIKLKYDYIVSIQTGNERDRSIIITKDCKLKALVSLTNILACLPANKFARIRWNEALNLSLVDRIDANILYIGRSSYSVDKKYAEEVFQAFHIVDKETVSQLEPSSYHDAIFLRVGEVYRRIKIDEILWIESYHNYCDVHIMGNVRPFCSVFPLTAWQKILHEEHFIRLHRSIIINANHIDGVQSGTVFIRDHLFKIPKAHRHVITNYFHLFQRIRQC